MLTEHVVNFLVIRHSLYNLYFCFFFFSSRRRHTRLVSDWSSDVCSSDLGRRQDHYLGRRSELFPPASRFDQVCGAERGKEGRSEERRVGKECRYRWSPYH